MWRNSSKPGAAGFTLMEVLVVLATLGMILWMAGQLLFPMRAAAERQRLQVEARQTARSAADYTAHLVRGATDLNNAATPFNPAAVLTYLWRGANSGTAGVNFPACPGDGSCVQLSYNNVDQAASRFASDGTDIITLTAAQVTSPVLLESASAWPNPFTDASVQYWAFSVACAPTANDPVNFAQFKGLTESTTGSGTSNPLLLVDPGTGAWLTYRIANYRDGNNSATCTVLNPTCIVGGVNVPCIEVNASPQDANSLNPPGGPEVLTNPPVLIVGSRFTTLRVCNGWLEQKSSTFNPAVDGDCAPLAGTVEFPELPPHDPSTGWSPLLPNVEDFQISYVYRNGETWNRLGATLSAPQGCTNGVPSFDAAPGTVNQYDARSVIALRVTITARSSTPVRLGGKMEFRQPAAEDHDPTTAPNDTYYRYQVSALAMLRNRTTRY